MRAKPLLPYSSPMFFELAITLVALAKFALTLVLSAICEWLRGAHLIILQEHVDQHIPPGGYNEGNPVNFLVHQRKNLVLPILHAPKHHVSGVLQRRLTP